jgi:hypothetical protein
MRTAFLCLLAASFFVPAHAQTNATAAGTLKTPDPQYLNQVYYCHSDSLLALEQTAGQIKNKVKALGFGGSETGYVMEGERSASRIPAGSDLRFAIKINMMMADPSTMIKLYRFDSKKGSRESLISAQGSTEIIYNVQKSGNDVFILSPTAKLPAGEYGFMNMMTMKGAGSRSISYTFFTFGID